MPRFQDIPQFIDYCGAYQVNVGWKYLEDWLKEYKRYGELDLDPDFQRDHVWTEAQESAYVEFVLQGGRSSRTLLWNHPCHFRTGEHVAGRDLPKTLVIVDGKQRLKAVRRFMAGELPAFGYKLGEYEDPKLLWRHKYDFEMYVNELQTRKDLLTWYVQLNTGGTVHSPEEIAKVRAMLAEEERKRATADPTRRVRAKRRTDRS